MLRGARILCATLDEDDVIVGDQYVPIEEIQSGDLVKTYLHGYQPVTEVQTFEIDNPDFSDKTDSMKRLYLLSSDKYQDLSGGDLVVVGIHCLLEDDPTEFIRHRALAMLPNADADVMESINQALNKVQQSIIAGNVDGKRCIPAFHDTSRASLYPVSGKHTIYQLSFDQGSRENNYGIYVNGLLVESTSL